VLSGEVIYPASFMKYSATKTVQAAPKYIKTVFTLLDFLLMKGNLNMGAGVG